METDFGSKIRARRKALGYTLAEVSSMTGLSISFISQVERSVTNPSIRSLRKLTTALGTSLAAMFSAITGSDNVVKKEERITFTDTDSKIRYQMLSQRVDGTVLEPVLLIAPSGYIGPENRGHLGEEFGMVLKGTAEYWIGNQKHVLEEGDSIHFSPDTLHKLVNNSNSELVMLWVATPPNF